MESPPFAQQKEWRTKMKIEAEKKTMFKFSASNKSSCMGCYFSEDDWDITEYAETLEELKEKAAISIIESDIYIDYWYLSIAEMLFYENHSFELSSEDCKEKYPKFLTEILSSDIYKIEKKKKEDEKKAKEERAKAKAEKEKLDAEKRQYEKLKKKFEEEN
jgi:hypothetical protein